MVWLKTRLYRIEQAGRRIDVDEYAIGQYQMEFQQSIRREYGRSDGDEAVEITGVGNQIVDMGKRREFHVLGSGIVAEHGPQFIEIGVRQFFLAGGVVEYGHTAWQCDTA